MYISAAQSKNRREVVVWERNKHGRSEKRFSTPYYFYVENENGSHKDIYGNRLVRLEFDDYSSFKLAADHYKNSGCKLFESDIRAEYKILAEHYYQTQLPDTHIMFFDIEVDFKIKSYESSKKVLIRRKDEIVEITISELRALPRDEYETQDENGIWVDVERSDYYYTGPLGYSTVEDPHSPISAIAIHKYWNGEDIVLVVPPPNRKGVTVQELGIAKEYPNVKIIICKNEKEVLKLFFQHMEDADIISGWNSSFYDVPYIYERAKLVFSENFANKLCFPGAPDPKYRDMFDKNGVPRRLLDIFGRESVDYMEIFKKFEVTERPSYSLEAISEEKFPNLKKLDYEGSLYSLYRDDFEHFVRYNIRDCEILKAMEDELGYARLAIQFAHSSTGLLRDVTGTLKLAELAIINFCHDKLGAIVPNSEYNIDGSGEKFAGALVLHPVTGMHDWVASVDVASLYPSALRAINGSPETIIGQFFDTYKAFAAIRAESEENLFFKYESGEMIEHTAKEWRKILLDKNCSISGYGSVFSMDKQGFVPAILNDWFAQRKAYKNRAGIAKTKMKTLEKNSSEYLAQKFEYESCHRLQFVFKIRLNSLYGALGNKYFKFYDVRLAESTTRTGQEVLMHMIRTVAMKMDGEYMYPSESIIYGDTDSCYFLTYATDKDEALLVGRAIEKAVNKSFPAFCAESFLCNDDFKDKISAELDVIASKSIFIKKKYYVMQLAYSEGEVVDKLKLMGVQLKKTTIPKPIAKRLSGYIEDLLKGRDWKEIGEEIITYKAWIVDEAPVVEIGLPKGIKGINEKEQQYRAGDIKIKLSGHASAALFYNLCLDTYDDKESLKITSGTKIKTYYLMRKFGRFKSIALPTDMKKPPEWFVEHFSGIIDREAQGLRLIDKPLANILTAISRFVPTRKNMMYDDLISY